MSVYIRSVNSARIKSGVLKCGPTYVSFGEFEEEYITSESDSENDSEKYCSIVDEASKQVAEKTMRLRSGKNVSRIHDELTAEEKFALYRQVKNTPDFEESGEEEEKEENNESGEEEEEEEGNDELALQHMPEHQVTADDFKFVDNLREISSASESRDQKNIVVDEEKSPVVQPPEGHRVTIASVFIILAFFVWLVVAAGFAVKNMR